MEAEAKAAELPTLKAEHAEAQRAGSAESHWRRTALRYESELRAGAGAEVPRVERFDRRGTEPFEPFEPFEFFQNRNFPEFFLRKFKNFRKFQHFLNYRRNSDKISSKSEQKSVKRIQK